MRFWSRNTELGASSWNKMTENNEVENEIDLTTSFLAKNLVITRRIDNKGRCA